MFSHGHYFYRAISWLVHIRTFPICPAACRSLTCSGAPRAADRGWVDQKRLAIIGFEDPSHWRSCQVIASNLKKAYRVAFQERQKNFEMSRDEYTEDSVFEQLAKDIFDYRPEAIVIADEAFPHPAPLLLKLKDYFGKRLPPLTIHIYGNFSLGVSDWLRIQDDLSQFRITFLAASESHRALVARLMKGHDAILKTCPFPVDRKIYHFNPRLRRLKRKEFGLGDDDHLFLYTGRMTYEKNVLRMIESMSRLLQKNQRAHFYLAGSFDHLGGTYQRQAPLLGEFYARFLELISNLPSTLRSRLRFLGHLAPTELRRLYNAADTFISFSTYHDEDFGMAPAEALMCGTNACLTAWGGYKGFAKASSDISFVPVSVDAQGLRFSEAVITEAMQQRMIRLSDTERLQRALRFAGVFSIEAIGASLQRIHQKTPPPFSGFSPRMHQLARRMDLYFQEKQSVFPEGQLSGTFYERLYKSYWSPV